LSLRLKTIIGIAIIQAILLLLLVSMALNYLRNTNYDALIIRASTTAVLFSTATKDAVLTYDLASLDAFVKEALITPDLVYVRVLGPDRELFVEGGEAKYLHREFVTDHRVEAVLDGVFDTFSDISEGGVIYGRVEIGLDISSINATIAEAQNRSVIIVGLEMGLVALLSFLLGAYLTRQLRVLSIAAQSISAGKLDIELAIIGNDEVSNVATAFNLMAINLKQVSERRDQFESELKNLNQFLEQRIEQRTQQIKHKNQELEEAHTATKESQVKLLQSEKMASIGVLAAGVAHEINNPIGFVMSNLHSLNTYSQNYRSLISEYTALMTLQGSNPQKELQLNISKINEKYDLAFMNEDIDSLLQDSIGGTERVRDIVKSLKEFSHVDTMANYTMYDLNDCIKSALKIVNNEIKYHCDIKTDLNELPLTYCCPGQISQICLNLIQNAGHAIKGQGVISIQSQHNGERLAIQVSDTGEGIPVDQLGNLFDPFYTTKPVGKGTGLGLSIAYGIAQEHEGEIKVVSEVGEGSRFTLTLPIKSEP
jgi:two-component system NtrC family sensor kinase